MGNPLAELVKDLLSSTWLVVLGGVVIAIYLWKILSSEEGFLFGYGDWIIGKWRNEPQADAQAQRQHGAPPERRQRRGAGSPEKELNRRANVLKLSRLLDGDLAYLMVNDAGEWETKILRALQTIVTGVTRVVRPVGRCRCGFFILDGDEQHLVLAAGEGYAGLQRPRLHLEHSCAGRAFVTGDNYYCRDIVTDPVYGHSARGRRDFRSIACAPVRAGNAIFGVMCLDAEEPDAFTVDDFTNIEIFSAKLAVFCAFHTLQAAGSCEFRPERGR